MIASWKGMVFIALAAVAIACEPSSDQKKSEAISEHGMKASQTAKEAMSSDAGLSINGGEEPEAALKKAKENK